MRNTVITFTLILVFLAINQVGVAQESTNYQEQEVPGYVLPSLLKSSGEKEVKTVKGWLYERRPAIIQLFRDEVYGQIPDNFDAIAYEIAHENPEAINGTAHLKEADIQVSRNGEDISLRLNIFIPNDVSGPAPVFLLINHRGPDNMDPTREIKKDFWPVEKIIDRGYATAVFDVEDVADDDAETYQNDVLKKLYPEQLKKDNGMRALSAWAWGAMRAMDYLVRDPDIDHQRSAVVGHSRGGKAALWTGANDQRFAITFSNESGCGGAALSRRRYGETIQDINKSFPHWFTPNFEKYNNNESALPVDQHMLIASIAPRKVYVASAKEDKWADPKGEFLSLKHSTKVYNKIFHLPIPNDKFESMPDINTPITESFTGHHVRTGEHDLKLYDWQQFMDFADFHFKP
jgi:hypothetical protein